jgi:hypothetical protein
VWTFKQLEDCYNVTEAYHIEADNVIVNDEETGRYRVDYVSVVLQREGLAWDLPQVQTNQEEIPPNFNEKKMEERFERFARKAARGILALMGAAERLKKA